MVTADVPAGVTEAVPPLAGVLFVGEAEAEYPVDKFLIDTFGPADVMAPKIRLFAAGGQGQAVFFRRPPQYPGDSGDLGGRQFPYSQFLKILF
jgi:hypothetical protein